MSIIHFAGPVGGIAAGISLFNLDGRTFNETLTTSSHRHGINFNLLANGQLAHRAQETTTGTSFPNDWYRPSGGATPPYEARCTVNSGDGPDGDSDLVNTWLNIAGPARNFWHEHNAGQTPKVGNWTFEIRQTGGAVVAAATIDITTVST